MGKHMEAFYEGQSAKCTIDNAEEEIDQLRSDLAQAQFDAKRLREAWQLALPVMDAYAGDNRFRMFKELQIPTNTSALEAMIQKAGEVMRERCAVVTSDTGWLFAKADDLKAARYNISHQARLLQAKNIRALPGVTLEDLKK